MVVKCWWFLSVWGPGGRHRSTPIAHNITFINNNIFIRWRSIRLWSNHEHHCTFVLLWEENSWLEWWWEGEERQQTADHCCSPPPPHRTPTQQTARPAVAAPRRSRPVLHASSALLVGGEGRWHPAGRGDGRLTDPSVPASLPPAGPPPPTTATERRRLCEGGRLEICNTT